MSVDLFAPYVKHEGDDYDDAPPPTQRFSKNDTYLVLVWRKFRRSVMGMIGLTLVLVLITLAVFADFFAPSDPKDPSLAFAPPDPISFFSKAGFSLRPLTYAIVETTELDPVTYQPLVGPDLDHPRPIKFFVSGFSYKIFGFLPASTHFFGTDDGKPFHIMGTDKLGRDIFSRGLVGSRISLMFALITVTVMTCIGTLVGLSTGYFGGRYDAWVQRIVDIFFALPQLPLYLSLVAIIPVTTSSHVFIAIVIFVVATLNWAQLSREVRGKTLALARIEYVRAAQAVGATDRRIVLRHILPNIGSHVIVFVTFWIPNVILIESFLGFLGFAVRPPLISWGMMLQDCGNFSVLGSYPWILSPVAFVLFTVFSFNALGDGLRDAIDPY